MLCILINVSTFTQSQIHLNEHVLLPIILSMQLERVQAFFKSNFHIALIFVGRLQISQLPSFRIAKPLVRDYLQRLQDHKALWTTIRRARYYGKSTHLCQYGENVLNLKAQKYINEEKRVYSNVIFWCSVQWKCPLVAIDSIASQSVQNNKSRAT